MHSSYFLLLFKMQFYLCHHDCIHSSTVGLCSNKWTWLWSCLCLIDGSHKKTRSGFFIFFMMVWILFLSALTENHWLLSRLLEKRLFFLLPLWTFILLLCNFLTNLNIFPPFKSECSALNQIKKCPPFCAPFLEWISCVLLSLKSEWKLVCLVFLKNWVIGLTTGLIAEDNWIWGWRYSQMGLEVLGMEIASDFLWCWPLIQGGESPPFPF